MRLTNIKGAGARGYGSCMNYSEFKGDRNLGLRVPGVEVKVAILSDPPSYDPSSRQIDVRETHMPWVFLTDGAVFKLRKPPLSLSRLHDHREACGGVSCRGRAEQVRRTAICWLD